MQQEVQHVSYDHVRILMCSCVVFLVLRCSLRCVLSAPVVDDLLLCNHLQNTAEAQCSLSMCVFLLSAGPGDELALTPARPKVHPGHITLQGSTTDDA